MTSRQFAGDFQLKYLNRQPSLIRSRSNEKYSTYSKLKLKMQRLKMKKEPKELMKNKNVETKLKLIEKLRN